MHTEALLDTIKLLNRHDRDFKKLCQEIISASILWTGEDEKKNPGLKKIRTLAGYYLNDDKDYFAGIE